MLATTTKLLLPPPQIHPKPIAGDSGLLFREKLIYLSDLNINTHKALTLNPNLRSTPLSSLVSVEETLYSFGLRRSSLGRILDMHPSLLTSDPHLHLYPVLDFLLHEVLIPFPQIPKCLYRCPRILVSSVPNQLRPALGFLRSIGFVGPSSIDAHSSLLLVYNVEFTLMSKIEYLVGLGFEFDEVKEMVVRSPGLLTLSIDRNLVPKTEYFVKEMKGNLKELKRFPQYFSFSLERKIKPRHRILEEYGLKLPLSKMLRFSDGEFNARLVDMLRIAEEKSALDEKSILTACKKFYSDVKFTFCINCEVLTDVCVAVSIFRLITDNCQALAQTKLLFCVAASTPRLERYDARGSQSQSCDSQSFKLLNFGDLKNLPLGMRKNYYPQLQVYVEGIGEQIRDSIILQMSTLDGCLIVGGSTMVS